MSDFALISQAIPQVFTLYNMLLIFGGLILGMVIGCVPGLSVTLGIILMLPLTYTFDDPASAIILLLAVYVGGMYGGSISAITLNTPGTNSAIATTFDGYPLAKKGKVKKLWIPRCLLRCSAACSRQCCCCFAPPSSPSWWRTSPPWSTSPWASWASA